jgi:hypothetical protein
MDGLLCDTMPAPDSIQPEDIASKHTVDIKSGMEIQAGDGITATIAPGSFMEETEFQVIHGFDVDGLGTTAEGGSNETTLGNAPEMTMYFDIVELVFNKDKLAGSIKLSMDYNTATIDVLNKGLAREYPGIFTITENDIGLYYFDKGRGEFILCKYATDRDNNKFILHTQLPGIYLVALKPVIFSKMKAYFEANPSMLQSAQAKFETTNFEENEHSRNEILPQVETIGDGSYSSSCDMCLRSVSPGYSTKNISGAGGLSPDGYAKEPPSEVNAWGEWKETNCSGPSGLKGAFIAETIYQLFGDKPFYNHDFCYRYGRGTYNQARKTCDDIMLTDMCRQIDQRYGFNGPKGWRKSIGIKKIWIPNPVYLAWKAITWPVMQYLYYAAGAVYGAVRLSPEGEASFMDNSSASKISGCYDYARKGIRCEIARLHDTIKDPDNRIYFPEDTVSFRARIFANQDINGILREKMGPGFNNRILDRIEWSLEPFSAGLSALQSTTSPYNAWTVPIDITPGKYILKTKLFDNAGLISSKTVNINIFGQSGSVSISTVQGGAYPDYITSAKKDSVGNVYTSHCITGNKNVFMGNTKVCVPRYCTSTGSYGISVPYPCGTTCFTVPIYKDFPTRTGKVIKHTASMNQQWVLDFPDEIIVDVALSSPHLYALSDGGNLIKAIESGTIAEARNIGLPGWKPFKVLTDQFNNVYVVYTINGSGFTVSKWDGMGAFISSKTGMAGSTVSDSVLANNSLYMVSNSGGNIYIEKYDLNLALQWSSANNITGSVISGNITVLPDGSAYLTGTGPSSVIFGSGGGNAYFVSKFDPFGNLLWRKGLNGAAPTQFPSLSDYYLGAATVLPVVRAGTDLKAYILSSPDLAVRTVSSNGDFEKVRTIPLYSGNVYSQDFFISPSGTLSVYGSTDGKITSGNTSNGTLDWFYLETENY